MHATDFGRTLIIANPAAQSGAAREVAERLQRFLDMTARASQFDLVLTERMGHAKELAAQATDYHTVIALGGDGVIHEVVNGLMTQKEDARPALAVLPVGSGNDYAETLGMAYSVPTAVTEILRFQTVRADVGRVNGRYFAETLSFGLDAAIALDTMDRRQKSGRAGTMLYLESAVDQLFHHLQVFSFKMDVLGA